MIKTPTVFVLGAGASAPYGFPTGSELIEDVIHINGGQGNESRFGYPEEKIQDFCDRLAGSFTDSIDVFLEKNSQYQTLGKRMIAHKIKECEKPEHIRMRNRGDNIELWYDKLLNVMDDSKHLEQFSDNAFSVITFNYDRSLEEFLYQSLCNRYSSASGEDVARQLCEIPFLHIHGSLGVLPWQSEFLKWDVPENPVPVPYGEPIDVGIAFRSAENVRIISDEDVDSLEVVHLAKQQLLAAKSIYFLGFGYHKTNIERLLSRIEWPDGERPMISGSTHGLTETEKEVAERLIHGIKLCPFSFQIKTFLRNSRRFLID